MANLKIPVYDVQYRNNFTIGFSIPPAVAARIRTMYNFDPTNEFGDFVVKGVRTITVPQVNIARKTDYFGTTTFHFRGNRFQFDTITAAFRVDKNERIYLLWRAWIDAYLNYDGRVGFDGMTGDTVDDTDYYTTTGIIKIQDSAKNIVKVYALVRMFPITVGQLSYGYDNDELLQFDVTLSFDWVLEVPVVGE